jgi:hypothetical protein
MHEFHGSLRASRVVVCFFQKSSAIMNLSNDPGARTKYSRVPSSCISPIPDKLDNAASSCPLAKSSAIRDRTPFDRHGHLSCPTTRNWPDRDDICKVVRLRGRIRETNHNFDTSQKYEVSVSSRPHAESINQPVCPAGCLCRCFEFQI